MATNQLKHKINFVLRQIAFYCDPIRITLFMSIFRTPLAVSKSLHPITIGHALLTVGSCFSDMLGNQLTKNKFKVSVNPFGTIYNPASLHKALRYTMYNELPMSGTYIEQEGVFSNYDFHSSFSHIDQTSIEKRIKEVIGFNHFFLKDCNHLIITYGTAWVHERNDTKEIVANCHKVPSQKFSKRLLTLEEITTSFDELYRDMKLFNPQLKIIITVSPVRHIKETLELNSVSKAILRLACHTLSETHTDVDYFPAYEILLDDLRDYRFYASDMIHPSADAEKYIWEKFIEQYFDERSVCFLEKWNKVQTALTHKPFHPQSAAHQRFLKDTLLILHELKSTVNVDPEINSVQHQLINP